MKRTRALLTTALPAALIAAVALTGCSSEGGSSANDQECTAPGDASSSIKLEGEFGGEVTLTSETPIEVTGIERSVLIEGDGDPLETGASAEATLSLFNGKTGEVIVPNEMTTVVNEPETLAPWAGSAIACATIGDRVVTVIPSVDVFGAGGGETYNLADNDAAVIVFDFIAEAPGEPGTLEPDQLLDGPEGTSQESPAGFPTVETGSDGSPSITMPEGVDAPTELSIAVLVEGTGEEVQRGDRVYVNYRGVIWRTGEEFDSSWSRGTPTDFMTTQVIGGFAEALEGQRVGSQIISVVPAEDGGYGGDWLATNGYEADDVMVFVLDILGTVHAD